MLIPHADKQKISYIFALCATTITAGGGNVRDMSLLFTTVCPLKTKAEIEAATAIKANFVFSQHLVVYFDGKKRKRH